MNHKVVDKIVLTESSYALVQESDTFVFKVRRNRNKIEIKKAIQDAFGVRVVSVNTMVTPGKVKAVRGRAGSSTKIHGSKKAFVKVHRDDVSKIPLI